MTTTVKATAKNESSVIIACPILSNGNVIEKDGETIVKSLDTAKVSVSLAEWLESIKPGTEVRVFNNTVILPSAGSFSARFNSLITRLVDAAFKGCDDYEQPTNEQAIAFLNGLKATKKIHFSDLRKVSVMRGLKIRVDNYREGIKAAKNATDSLKPNEVLLKETDTLKKVNKAFKDGGRPAVEKLLAEKKGTKVIGWNE